MDLNGLLKRQGIDSRQVLVMRHRPSSEPQFAEILPSLAAGRPDLFNAYQGTQNRRVEKAMLGAEHVASFIGHGPGKALFVGLYAIGKCEAIDL